MLQAGAALPDLRCKLLSEQTMAPQVGRAGTGVNWGLQITGQLIAGGSRENMVAGLEKILFHFRFRLSH